MLVRVDGPDLRVPDGYAEVWRDTFTSDREVDVTGEALSQSIRGLRFCVGYADEVGVVYGYFYVPIGYTLEQRVLTPIGVI